MSHILYDCGICGCYHPWAWNGDCREDANRYGSPEDYAAAHGCTLDEIVVRQMEERVAADRGEVA